MTDDDHEPGDTVPPIDPPTDAEDLVEDVRKIVGDGGDAVDPEDARPEGHYPRFDSNTWHYVPDDLAKSISLGPGGDGETGQDWVLSYTPERRDPEDREKVFIRLSPPALQELYIEVKDLSPDARQAGHTAECGLCGEQVALDKAWPDNRDRPCHPDCYADAFGRPPWY